MKVIKGKKAYIEFTSGESSMKFGCAQSFSFEEQIETKSVKTKGDGYKRRYRGQSASATINLSGLVMYDDADFITPFDLAAYCDQMLDIGFTIYFDDESGEHVSGIFGHALVITANLGGDTSFARSNFTLQCNEWTLGLPPVCTAAITSHTLTRQGLTFIYHVAILAVTTGSVPRYDWRLDGQGTDSTFSTGWPVNVTEASNFIYGTHSLEIWPVCSNGVRGTKLTRTFTVPFG